MAGPVLSVVLDRILRQHETYGRYQALSTSVLISWRRCSMLADTMSTMISAERFILSMPLSGNSQARHRTRGDRKGNRNITGVQTVEGANAACTAQCEPSTAQPLPASYQLYPGCPKRLSDLCQNARPLLPSLSYCLHTLPACPYSVLNTALPKDKDKSTTSSLCRCSCMRVPTALTMVARAAFIRSKPLSGNAKASRRTMGARKGNRNITGAQAREGEYCTQHSSCSRHTTDTSARLTCALNTGPTPHKAVSACLTSALHFTKKAETSLDFYTYETRHLEMVTDYHRC